MIGYLSVAYIVSDKKITIFIFLQLSYFRNAQHLIYLHLPIDYEAIVNPGFFYFYDEKYRRKLEIYVILHAISLVS